MLLGRLVSLDVNGRENLSILSSNIFQAASKWQTGEGVACSSTYIPKNISFSIISILLVTCVTKI
jgi:hypothetical protein